MGHFYFNKTMNKEQVFAYLDKEGMTSLAVEHPETPKKWVMDWFDEQQTTRSFRDYYNDFIEYNFK